MFEKVSDDISMILLNNSIIKNDERKFYIYGLEMFIMKLAFFVLAMLFAVITHNAITSFVFLFSSTLIRERAGGYHCKTPFVCFCTSLLIFLAMLFTINITDCGTTLVNPIVSTVSTIIILATPILENENNPMSSMEKKNIKIQSVIISLCLLALEITSFLINFREINCATSWSLTVTAVLMIIEKVRRWNCNEKFGIKDDCQGG